MASWRTTRTRLPGCGGCWTTGTGQQRARSSLVGTGHLPWRAHQVQPTTPIRSRHYGETVPALRSRTTTQGRNAAGARALWRATGMTESDFGKPIVAIANSYTQFVPGHVHLRDLGDIVAEAVRAAGGVPREFHTIAVDDGIAMGHGGMLYSLPSREIIADSVEYMVNAHTADALVCISNCDKITPGMLNATMRLNIPTVFVSGGPMEAGKAVVVDGVAQAPTDLITAIAASASPSVDE